MFSKALKRLSKDWFLLGMISAVALASLVPDVGRTGGYIHADVLADYGIFLVFFFHGLGLSTEQMWSGMSRWKMHVVVQLLTFAVFPLLWLGLNAAFGKLIPPGLMLGFFYLCALPSTISSSVAMTAVAKGNVPGAIFNATLSSLLGVFLTPFFVSLLTSSSGGSLSLGDAILKISLLLLLPFLLGQAVRPLLGKWFAKYKRYINTFDKSVILMLVYGSFCDSVKSGLWTDYGFWILGVTMLVTACILATVLFLSSRAARLMGFNREDSITTIMCGSKKTLASGVPMAKLLFGANPTLGLIVLPIMFYHQLQLFACSILAERFAKSARSRADA